MPTLTAGWLRTSRTPSCTVWIGFGRIIVSERKGTESLSKPGLQSSLRMSGSSRRQCGRTIGVEPALAQAFLEQRQSGDKGPADVSTVAQGQPRALKSFSHAPVYFCIVIPHCTK